MISNYNVHCMPSVYTESGCVNSGLCVLYNDPCTVCGVAGSLSFVPGSICTYIRTVCGILCIIIALSFLDPQLCLIRLRWMSHCLHMLLKQ